MTNNRQDLISNLKLIKKAIAVTKPETLGKKPPRLYLRDLVYRPDTVRGANDSHAPIVITTDSEFQICNCVVSPQVPQGTRMSSARGPLTRRPQCPSTERRYTAKKDEPISPSPART